jgi:Protein of unknown function (DUF1329)
MRIVWNLTVVVIVLSVVLAGPIRCASAQTTFSSGGVGIGSATSPIPPGTTITNQNWQQYRSYMSDGLQALFEGKYFWKMPADVRIAVGPTVVNPPPRNYQAATESYANDVKLVNLPDGGLTLRGYRGGTPFPNPSDPHKGWKILANVIYRYVPHSIVINHAGGCSIDRNADINCATGDIVFRQMSFNTDPGVPATQPGFEDVFWTQWYIVTQPEQMRYTASLTIAHTDPARSEDLYAFIPSLRRYQPVSPLARCSMTDGMDITSEDYRSGFDSNLTEMSADYVGEKKILALILPKMPGKFPGDYDMPLAFPKPSWGQWQVRDVYVISASKLPSRQSGYCYGKRVMYIDKTSYNTYWEDLYDRENHPWKIAGLFLHTINVPGIGQVDSTGSLIYAFWDLQNNHASFIGDPTDSSYPVYINEQVPQKYLDNSRYSTPSGLNLIMR